MSQTYNTRNPAVKRLLKEAQELSKPTELYHAQPLEDNLFEWHFTIRGPEDTDFDGGIYHGRILLPSEYPMKPPNIVLLTPNGRFETHRKICLSISGYHPESWRPSWSIRTALLAIIGFMPTHGAGAIGSLDLPSEERKALALKSRTFICDSCGAIQHLLKPLTDASRPVSQEATETASQIALSGEREAKSAPQVEADSPATSGSSTEKPPTETNPAPAPFTVISSSTVVSSTTSNVALPSCSTVVSTSVTPTPFPFAAPWMPNLAASASMPPNQIAYWLCYPIYYYPFPPTATAGFQQVVPTRTASGDVVAPMPSDTSTCTLSTTPSGDQVPLSFTEWLKQAREKRTTEGFSDQHSVSADLNSTALTRTVVTNASTYLAHRASASFTVHKNPVSISTAAQICTSQCILDAPVPSTVTQSSHSPKSPISPETVSSEEKLKTVIERAYTGEAAGERPESNITMDGLSEAQEDAIVVASCNLEPEKDQHPITELKPSATISGGGSMTSAPTLDPNQAVHISPPALKSEEKTAEADEKPQNLVTQKRDSKVVFKDPTNSNVIKGDHSAFIQKGEENQMEVNPSPTSSMVPTTFASSSFQSVHEEEEEEEEQETSCAVRQRSTSPFQTDDPSVCRSTELNARTASSLLSPDNSRQLSEPINMSTHYRAVSVCAAGVAVALFLVVMRRLALMLHGV